MDKYRQSFAEVDASSINDESFTLNLGIDESGEEIEPNVSLTVEFKEVEAASGEQLEQRLDELAKQALEDDNVSPGEDKGYEVVKEYGDTYREVGFAVTSPHL